MANRDDDIIRQLEDISFRLGDLNAIRHGEYEPPRGAEQFPKHPQPTPYDIYHRLGTIISLLERQNTMIDNIGLNAVKDEDFWRNQNVDY